MDRQELKDEFLRQAEWRSQKAIEHPHDARNEEAANLYLRLAESVDRCPQEVIAAAGELFDDLPDAEVWLDAMNKIGFHSWPESAEEFCRAFIADRTGG